ncbi:hypothetical protein SDC9_179028 [bioreactor metagenome]|uniref:Uncharacterized protein n=1 Tax=bioreactor metagenome TaxID=1076179 RepID=A0A645H5L5_9ZZZZ
MNPGLVFDHCAGNFTGFAPLVVLVDQLLALLGGILQIPRQLHANQIGATVFANHRIDHRPDLGQCAPDAGIGNLRQLTKHMVGRQNGERTAGTLKFSGIKLLDRSGIGGSFF